MTWITIQSCESCRLNEHAARSRYTRNARRAPVGGGFHRRRTLLTRASEGIRSIGFVGISGSDRTEEPVLFPVRTCGEEQRVGGTVVRRPVAKLEGPQSVDCNRSLLRVSQHTLEGELAVWPLLIGVDSAVAKVADKQVAPEA